MRKLCDEIEEWKRRNRSHDDDNFSINKDLKESILSRIRNCDKIDEAEFRRIFEPVQVPVLVIDGITIFNGDPTLDYDLKYFMTMSKAECKKRRALRVDYVPPDPPSYFEKVVWPCYERNKHRIKNQSEILFINAENSMIENFKHIAQHFIRQF